MSSSNHEFEQSLTDIDKINLSQLFRILSKIKLRLLGTISFLFLTYSSGLLVIGYIIAMKHTAVSIRYPFDLTLDDKIVPEKLALEKVYLVEITNLYPLPQGDKNDNQGDKNDNQIHFEIRRIEENATIDTIKIGSIDTERRRLEINFFKQLLGIFNSVYAQTPFDWKGREDNYSFYEEYKDLTTIWRYYNDGSILEYQVDSQGASIPSTFRWIRG